ncbi:MAG: GIY-YIG nuclease family protein [Candidatus Paceibacterota bacterium]|jgi:putative endonuclease
MYYVYILKSKKDDELYTGSTNNLVKRFNEHNSGKVFSTKSRHPFMLIYYEAYADESDARHREHNLKLRANALSQLKQRISQSLKVH